MTLREVLARSNWRLNFRRELGEHGAWGCRKCKAFVLRTADHAGVGVAKCPRCGRADLVWFDPLSERQPQEFLGGAVGPEIGAESRHSPGLSSGWPGVLQVVSYGRAAPLSHRLTAT
jgi:hypothetical protein